jgi:predicted phosphodiesterase
MKIQVASDVHLEFGGLNIENAGDTDVLILSGDICVAHDLQDRDVYSLKGERDKSNVFHAFFQECCARFPNVIYVAGNHEHYHGDYAKTLPHLKEKLGYLNNLHILDKESVLINDVLFVGGTLWTDMNKEDPNTLYAIKGYMNDYRIIDDSSEVVHYKSPVYGVKEDGTRDWDNVVSVEFHTRPGKFSPEKSVVDHKAMLTFIEGELARVGPQMKVVVVGHHAPSKASTKPQYEKDVIVNGAYSSDLSGFILDHPQIKLWTHGHTHHEFDYMIGSTRIFCNPRGYIGYEHQADVFDVSKVVEV